MKEIRLSQHKPRPLEIVPRELTNEEARCIMSTAKLKREAQVLEKAVGETQEYARRIGSSQSRRGTRSLPPLI